MVSPYKVKNIDWILASFITEIENIAAVSDEAAGIEQMAATTQQSSNPKDEISGSTKSLKKSAANLTNLIQRFKIK